MRRTTLAPVLAVAALLAGCGSEAAQQATSSTATSSTATASSTAAEATPSASAPAGTEATTTGFLERNGLAGKDVETIVSELDRTQADKARGLMGSVRADELQLTDATGQQVSLPIPSDRFYLSLAPYLTQTHDCTWHHLTGCQGELAGKAMTVRITDAGGRVLVDEQATTYENGFVGYWLPRGITGTVTVAHEGKQVSAPFSTAADSPTCVTTLRLT